MFTHYDFLELTPVASAIQISAAYALLRERRSGSERDELYERNRVERIEEAYAVLSNPERRAAYDAELKRSTWVADCELNWDARAPRHEGSPRYLLDREALKETQGEVRRPSPLADEIETALHGAPKEEESATAVKDQGRFSLAA